MNFRPKIIRNEAEYQSAIKALDAIFDAVPGSLEAEKADLLTFLIEQFEAENFPISAPEPFEAIRFRLDQMGIELTDLEAIFGKSVELENVLANPKKAAAVLFSIVKMQENMSSDWLETELKALREPQKMAA